ncbi:pancreatic lipase-related protein 3-like [Culicoides brevitarsis]|uniref:pancreatic lipase-related protein 3-like n=1 Tax=Culicoides brevitarsis TaxID=469753 RepID=UPI00307CC1AE
MAEMLSITVYFLAADDANKPKNMNEAIIYSCNRPLGKGKYKVFAIFANESNLAEKIDFSKKIVFLIHGNEPLPHELKHDYSTHVDANVCEIIWARVEDVMPSKTRKTRAAASSEFIAYFITKLHEKHQVDYGRITMVGHGIGAQIAGVVGNRIGGGRDKKGIGEIYALNPYGRREIDKQQHIDERLSLDDANYVQVIQTTNGEYLQDFAHQVFHPNLGKAPQLPCIYKDDATDECADKMAIEYFRYSLDKNNVFMGQQCLDSYFYLRRECFKKQDRMGIYAKKKVNGHFFFETFGAPPYTPRDYNKLMDD